MAKIKNILSNAIPILLMIVLIPLVGDDYILTGMYAVLIVISFLFKREEKDFLVFVFGFFIMIVFERLFVATGVEKFQRDSLFGVMPLWLPFLWAYSFVAIKRSVLILVGK